MNIRKRMCMTFSSSVFAPTLFFSFLLSTYLMIRSHPPSTPSFPSMFLLFSLLSVNIRASAVLYIVQQGNTVEAESRRRCRRRDMMRNASFPVSISFLCLHSFLSSLSLSLPNSQSIYLSCAHSLSHSTNKRMHVVPYHHQFFLFFLIVVYLLFQVDFMSVRSSSST
jgi:hypothetical protein